MGLSRLMNSIFRFFPSRTWITALHHLGALWVSRVLFLCLWMNQYVEHAPAFPDVRALSGTRVPIDMLRVEFAASSRKTHSRILGKRVYTAGRWAYSFKSELLACRGPIVSGFRLQSYRFLIFVLRCEIADEPIGVQCGWISKKKPNTETLISAVSWLHDIAEKRREDARFNKKSIIRSR